MSNTYTLIAPGHGGIFKMAQHNAIAFQNCKYSVGVFAKLSKTHCFAAHIIAHNPNLKNRRAQSAGRAPIVEDGYDAVFGSSFSLDGVVREAIAASLRAAGIEVANSNHIRAQKTESDDLKIVCEKFLDEGKKPLIGLVLARCVLYAFRSPINEQYYDHIGWSEVTGEGSEAGDWTWVNKPVPYDGFHWVSSSLFDEPKMFIDLSKTVPDVTSNGQEDFDRAGWHAVLWQETVPRFSFAWELRDPSKEDGGCCWKSCVPVPS